MLTRLLPDQISKLWDIIRYAIENSGPTTDNEQPDRMNRILSAALSGRVSIWASYVKGEVNKFEGIVVTDTLYDDATGIKNLLIYSIYGYVDKVDKKSYVTGISALSKYAKSLGCTNIVAYTKDREIVALVNRLGGDTSYTMLSFNVDEIVQKLNDLSGGE
jgi:hypothetical protein